MAADWSALHSEVLDVISTKLEKLSDNLNFTVVCSSWRSAGIRHRSKICRPFFPRLVVAGETKDSATRGYLEAVQGEDNGYSTFCYADKDDKNLTKQIPVPHGYYCCGSSLGWLVLIDDNFDMQLFNPLSGASFELPSSTTLPPAQPYWRGFCKYYVEKAIISVEPTTNTPTSSETIVLIIYRGAADRLAFCRLGDKVWTPIEKPEGTEGYYYADIIYSKGKFYAIRNPGNCDIVDIEHQTAIRHVVSPPSEIYSEKRYIVESESQLYLVVRKVEYDSDFDLDSALTNPEDEDEDEADVNNSHDKGDELENKDDGDETDVDNSYDDGDVVDECSDDDGDEPENNDHPNKCTGCGGTLKRIDWGKVLNQLRGYRTVQFRVYKLTEYPDGSRIWTKVENIGNNAFFIGRNNSFSLPATDNLGYKTCKPNSIYFTDDRMQFADGPDPIRHDIGVFNLDSQTTEPIYPADTVIMRPLPFWFTLKL